MGVAEVFDVAGVRGGAGGGEGGREEGLAVLDEAGVDAQVDREGWFAAVAAPGLHAVDELPEAGDDVGEALISLHRDRELEVEEVGEVAFLVEERVAGFEDGAVVEVVFPLHVGEGEAGEGGDGVGVAGDDPAVGVADDGEHAHGVVPQVDEGVAGVRGVAGAIEDHHPQGVGLGAERRGGEVLPLPVVVGEPEQLDVVVGLDEGLEPGGVVAVEDVGELDEAVVGAEVPLDHGQLEGDLREHAEGAEVHADNVHQVRGADAEVLEAGGDGGLVELEGLAVGAVEDDAVYELGDGGLGPAGAVAAVGREAAEGDVGGGALGGERAAEVLRDP